jgi:ABC-type nitrate/sulfonate/bicarbonate transport system substrate-binding protein
MRTIRLALEWFLNPDHVPFIVAQKLGWFAQAGLQIELIEPAEHLDALAAIQAGEIDVAVTEPLHLVDDACEGAPLIGFARFLHTRGGVMYERGKGIERPRDMVGKRLQYPGAPGPGGPAIVRTMIEADGGPAHADITPVNNGFFHTDAIAQNKADLATLIFYNFEVIEARHRGMDVDYFALQDWGVPDFCQLILITSKALLTERRDDLSALCAILHRAVAFTAEHPEDARRMYAEHTSADFNDALTAGIFQATVGCFTRDFALDTAYYDALNAWMLRTGQVSTTLPVDSYWTNDMVVPLR